ncbi:MAG: hypothetical protein LBL59_09270 [Xanthomonadaceae bacterium]|jgi:nucleoside-diphosphate-sugar epimerase|nr:hypothetical protein [Xanthomonadaceae bacterium]
MSIFVVGATSQIGHFLLPRLREAGIDVIALSRHGGKTDTPQLRWLSGDLGQLPVFPEAAGAALQGIVSFGPLEALAGWLGRMPAAPAPRLVATSSMSVLTKQSSGIESEREMVRHLAVGEARVIEQCRRLGIGWTLLRPTLIYGAGLDRNITPIAQRAARWRLFPLPAGDGLRQPVHADDLADAILRCLSRENAQGRTLSLGGGERLRASEMFARVRAGLPLYTVPVRLWRPLLGLMAWLLPATRGPISRLRKDLIVDNAEAMQLLEIQPRPFRPDPGMLGFPDTPARGRS